MVEHIQNAGRKHWYGDHWVQLQKEGLDILQSFFKQFGAFILQGCDITPNAGTPANNDISAGIVAINHADGFKIVRFAGVTNVSGLGYLTVSRTDVNGVYNSGAGVIAYNYAAVYNPTPLASYTSFQLPFNAYAPAKFDFNKAMANYQYTEWRTFTVSLADASGTLKVRVDKVAHRLQIVGSLLIKNMAGWITDYEEITVLPQSVLAADAVIGQWALFPSIASTGVCAFTGTTTPALLLEDVNNKTIITHANAIFDGNLKVNALKSDGNVNYYVAVKMDVDLTV